jgi:hypothetical protein
MYNVAPMGVKYYEVKSIKGPSYFDPSSFDEVVLVGPLNDIHRVSVDSNVSKITHVQIIFDKVVRSFKRGQIIEIDMPLVEQDKP